jgi:hypothetical protein
MMLQIYLDLDLDGLDPAHKTATLQCHGFFNLHEINSKLLQSKGNFFASYISSLTKISLHQHDQVYGKVSSQMMALKSLAQIYI